MTITSERSIIKREVLSNQIADLTVYRTAEGIPTYLLLRKKIISRLGLTDEWTLDIVEARVAGDKEYLIKFQRKKGWMRLCKTRHGLTVYNRELCRTLIELFGTKKVENLRLEVSEDVVEQSLDENGNLKYVALKILGLAA